MFLDCLCNLLACFAIDRAYQSAGKVVRNNGNDDADGDSNSADSNEEVDERTASIEDANLAGMEKESFAGQRY